MGGRSDDNYNGERNMDQGDLSDDETTMIIELQWDSSMIKGLIGKRCTGCNSGDDSFGEYSCSTHLNSTPMLGLSMMDRNARRHVGSPPRHMTLPVDNGSFGDGNKRVENSSFEELAIRKVERVETGRFSRASRIRDATGGSRNGNPLENGELGDTTEGSAISEQVPLPSITNSAQKRKFFPRGKTKESPATSWANDTEDFGEKEQLGDKKSKDENAVLPKDYIHVRARRGQATDSHSLAERARREKISQRMKVLQGLVPGCNKVTGKAVILDEIINYVQSLQRQVEFLSMKLTTLNPRMDFNVEDFLWKEMSNPLGSSFFSVDSSSSVFPDDYQPHQVMHLQGVLCSSTENQIDALNVAVHTCMDGFWEAPSTGVSGLWEDELHSIVHTR